jgi:hypothetical protein
MRVTKFTLESLYTIVEAVNKCSRTEGETPAMKFSGKQEEGYANHQIVCQIKEKII